MMQAKLLLAVLIAALGYCLFQIEIGQGFALGFLMLAILFTFGSIRERAHGAQLQALKARHEALVAASAARLAELDELKQAVLTHIATTQQPHRD